MDKSKSRRKARASEPKMPSLRIVIPEEFQENTQEEKKTPSLPKRFTPEEDKRLIDLVYYYGTMQWNVVAREFEGRTPRQVRDRYCNYLSPLIKAETWSNKENRNLIALCESYGKHWNQLTKFFPGRTDTDLRNHYNLIVKHPKRYMNHKAQK